MTFGQGPRNCIGMRFALLEAKMGIVALMSKYSLKKTARTPDKITYDPSSVLAASLDELWVKAERRSA